MEILFFIIIYYRISSYPLCIGHFLALFAVKCSTER